MPTTFTMMRDGILTNARRIGEGFTKPDDDWRPMLFVVQRFPPNLAIIPVARMTNTPERRERLFNVALPLVVRFADAACLGLLSPVWFKEVSYAGRTIEQARRDLPDSIHADPERQEMLWVEISDGDEDETWTAKIRRRPKAPPLLDEWGLMPGRIEHEGRIGRACYRAFHAELPTDPHTGQKYDPDVGLSLHELVELLVRAAKR